MIWSVLSLLLLCIAHPSYQASPRIRQLAQFPNPTWIENIAVRSNGHLLVTLFSSPELYEIDPLQPNTTPKLVAQFPEALGILGIAEIEQDVYAITKGNFSSQTGQITPESFSVWKADLRQETAALSRIVDMPEAIILNGVTTVKKGSKFILIADSVGGVIWRVNIETSAYDVVLNNTATQPTFPTFEEGAWAANGVHTRDGVLFFTNTNRGVFRVPIHDDGTPAGDVETLAEFTFADDFTFSERGDLYIARGRNDTVPLVKVTPGGEVVELTHYENPDAPVLLEGNTAAAFGRTGCDKSTLYVTTNGGWSGLINGTTQVGGRVLAIDFGENL